MRSTLQTATVLSLLAASASAANPVTSCRTEMGRKSTNHVPTVSYTATDLHQPTTTVTVQPTVTQWAGYWYTITKFVTKTMTTTDTTVTDTFSTTTTEFSVETDTVTSTVTTTETDTSTTSSTSTTIIPTTAGFRNIKDTLNSYNMPGRRELTNPHAPRAVADPAKQGVLAMAYPTRVACTKILPNTKTQTVYTTVAPVTVKKPYWGGKTTKTNTIRTTTTIVPDDVSTTVTSTSTSSVTTYVTTFATNTQTTVTTTTNILPGPTLFDACKPENIFQPTWQHGGASYYSSNVANNGPGVASDFRTVADGASSAVECCNACQRFGTCETFIFRQRNRNCFLLYHDGETCPNQSNHPNYILSRQGADPGSGYVVGNGNCGFTYSGNSDGSVYSVDGWNN